MLESCSFGIVMQLDNMKVFWRLLFIQVYITLPKGILKMDKVINSILCILSQLKIQNISHMIVYACNPNTLGRSGVQGQLGLYDCLKTTTNLRSYVTIYHYVNLCGPLGNVANELMFYSQWSAALDPTIPGMELTASSAIAVWCMERRRAHRPVPHATQWFIKHKSIFFWSAKL